MRPMGVQRFKKGNSGAYTDDYHRLLGTASWIIIRHLDSGAPRSGEGRPDTISLSEGDVATVFSQFGEVTDVRFVRHHRSGRFLGTAFVKFADHPSAILAANTANSDVENGREVRLTAWAERGIQVERCEESEVFVLLPGAQSYTEWLAQLKTEAA